MRLLWANALACCHGAIAYLSRQGCIWSRAQGPQQWGWRQGRTAAHVAPPELTIENLLYVESTMISFIFYLGQDRQGSLKFFVTSKAPPLQGAKPSKEANVSTRNSRNCRLVWKLWKNSEKSINRNLRYVRDWTTGQRRYIAVDWDVYDHLAAHWPLPSPCHRVSAVFCVRRRVHNESTENAGKGLKCSDEDWTLKIGFSWFSRPNLCTKIGFASS